MPLRWHPPTAEGWLIHAEREPAGAAQPHSYEWCRRVRGVTLYLSSTAKRIDAPEHEVLGNLQRARERNPQHHQVRNPQHHQVRIDAPEHEVLGNPQHRRRFFHLIKNNACIVCVLFAIILRIQPT